MSNYPKPPFDPETIDPPGIESNMRAKPNYKAEEYKASGKFTNKVALITGGDSGIGRAVALLFAREGADIILSYLPEEKKDTEAIEKEIQSLGRNVLLAPGDVADHYFCQSLCTCCLY